MTSPFSGWVLGTGTLLASPALYAAVWEQTLPLQTGLVRFLVAVAVTWLGLSLLDTLLHHTSARPEPDEVHVPRALPPGDSAH